MINKAEKKPFGVVVGRFQVADLHSGHLHLLKKAFEHSEHVLIFVGTAATPLTRKNPLDFLTRKLMLADVCPIHRVTILPLPDNRSDAKWVKSLDAKIREIFPFVNSNSIFLYHSRDSFAGCYREHNGSFVNSLFDVGDELDESLLEINGTAARENIAKFTRCSGDFRAGVIYAAYNHYPRVQPTVDIAVYYEDKNGEYHILFGTKDLENFQLCFPGGFIDMSDESAEHAARRELREETTYDDAATFQFRYLATTKIDDWRNTSNTSVLTTFFGLEIQEEAADVNGEWRDVYKDPISDPGKKSLRGRLGLFVDSNDEYTTRVLTPENEDGNCLIPVFRNGKLLFEQHWNTLKARAEI